MIIGGAAGTLGWLNHLASHEVGGEKARVVGDVERKLSLCDRSDRRCFASLRLLTGRSTSRAARGHRPASRQCSSRWSRAISSLTGSAHRT